MLMGVVRKAILENMVGVHYRRTTYKAGLRFSANGRQVGQHQGRGPGTRGLEKEI